MQLKPIYFAALFLSIALAGTTLLGHIPAQAAPQFHFTLIDQNGREATESRFKGTPLLLFFGFTGCSGICPVTLQRMGAVIGALNHSGTKLEGLFVTIDPAHDTPRVMSAYLKNFPAGVTGLTGRAEAITPLYAAFRIYPGHSDMGTQVGDHSGLIYLVDGAGETLAHYTLQTDPETMRKMIVSALGARKGGKEGS
jgi:protein SCO1/2